MPFVAKALLDKRARFARWAERMGEEALFAKHPAARGYLRPTEGYRLMDHRAALVDALLEELRQRRDELDTTDDYPLAPLTEADESPHTP